MTLEAPFVRESVALYCFAYIVICGAWRTWVVYRRIGRVPVTIFGQGTDSAHGYVAAISKVLILMIGAVVVLGATGSPLYERLGPIPALEVPGVTALGLLALAISLPLVAVAQAQMGDSWRIGIDSGKPTELVAGRGLYRFSRNPIYLGMLLTNVGLFLTLPNIATLFILLVGFLSLQIQIRLEEAFLHAAHPESFARFRNQVRRWL